MGSIYHIAFASDWKDAQDSGIYTISTRGKTLDEQGFIHAGVPSQVAPVANAIYRGDKGLLILVIDEDRVDPEVRYEMVPGWDDPFPHIYGPLNVDAVVRTLPFEADADGQFSFTIEEN